MDNLDSNIPFLVQQQTGDRFALSAVTIVGRHEDCDIVLKDERGASRKHARITVQEGVVLIMDLGSLNGTLVNGKELEHQCELQDGDAIIFDEQKYTCSIPAVDISNQVTVIADKNEKNNPEQIRSQIKLVDEPATVLHANQMSDDAFQTEQAADQLETGSAQIEPQADATLNDLNSFHAPFEDAATDNELGPHTAIPATSRPGGDAIPDPHKKKRSNGIAGSRIAYTLLGFIVLIAVLAVLAIRFGWLPDGLV